MTHYEALFVFKPFIDVDSADNVLKLVEKSAKSAGGKIVKTDKMGRKRLAYEINKFKDGFFVAFILEMPPEGVDKFRQAFSHNEEVLRITILKVDEAAMTSMANSKANRENQVRERQPSRGR